MIGKKIYWMNYDRRPVTFAFGVVTKETPKCLRVKDSTHDYREMIRKDEVVSKPEALEKSYWNGKSHFELKEKQWEILQKSIKKETLEELCNQEH
jgi:hypothetical protein